MKNRNKTIASPESSAAPVNASADIGFMLLSYDLIDDPEQPMRSEMTIASVEDLVMSIKQVGLIEPLIVKPVNGRYEVIAGHRRLFAARLAKMPEVPCYVRKANDEQTEMLKIHENLYRAEIKPADEAKHFDYLIQKQHMTPEKIAQMISKSPTYVYDRMEILSYPDFLREAMVNGEISFTVAKEFSRFEDLTQMQRSIYYAKRGGMTQEMARKWVNDFKRSKEHNALIEPAQPNGAAAAQPIEHTAMCVYCHEGLRLIEAEVVYMHSKCLLAVNTPAAETTVSTIV